MDSEEKPELSGSSAQSHREAATVAVATSTVASTVDREAEQHLPGDVESVVSVMPAMSSVATPSSSTAGRSSVASSRGPTARGIINSLETFLGNNLVIIYKVVVQFHR